MHSNLDWIRKLTLDIFFIEKIQKIGIVNENYRRKLKMMSRFMLLRAKK